MLLSNRFTGLRARIRYLRYSRNQSSDFTSAMTDALFLNPRRHPVLKGPEELSRYFVYSANREHRRNILRS